MPMVYSCSLATAGNTATHATPNTETGVFFLKPGSTLGFRLFSIDVIGKGAALTTLSGIGFRVVRWGTASTAGTSFTPTPKDAGMQASVTTGASAPTVGTTRTNRVIFGCSATNGGGWWAKHEDDEEVLRATAQSLDMLSVSGTASLNFEWFCAFKE